MVRKALYPDYYTELRNQSSISPHLGKLTYAEISWDN